jgi:hypothetical protein
MIVSYFRAVSVSRPVFLPLGFLHWTAGAERTGRRLTALRGEPALAVASSAGNEELIDAAVYVHSRIVTVSTVL